MEDTMKINGVEYPVKGNNYAIVKWEEETGKPFSKLESHTDNMRFLFWSVKAGAKSLGKVFSMKFDEFIDYIDDHPDILPEKEGGKPGKK